MGTSVFSPSVCQVITAHVQFHRHGFWLLPVLAGPPFGYPQHYDLIEVLRKLAEIALKATYNHVIIPAMLP